MKELNISLQIIVYALVLLLYLVIPDFNRYNPFVLLLLSIISFYKMPVLLSVERKVLLFSCMVIFLFDMYNGISFVYAGISLANIYFILSTLTNVNSGCLKKGYEKYIIFLCVFFLLLSLVCTFFDSFYSYQEDQNVVEYDGQLRYQGILHASNISSSVVLLLLILLWETEKKCIKDKRRCLLLVFGFILAYFAVYLILSKTRTLFLALPYLGYQIYKLLNIRYLISMVFLFILLLVYYIDWDKLDFTTLRVSTDSSSLTREYLYIEELGKIISSYVIIPNGSHTMTDFVVKLMGDEDYTPHNDFFRYAHDWGGIFLLILYRLYKSLQHNIETLLIILIVSGCALHNVLFSPLIIIPLYFILLINYKK